MKPKIYRHMFSKSGIYLGQREVTRFDYIRPYMWIGLLIVFCVGLILLVTNFQSHKDFDFNKNSNIELSLK